MYAADSSAKRTKEQKNSRLGWCARTKSEEVHQVILLLAMPAFPFSKKCPYKRTSPRFPYPLLPLHLPHVFDSHLKALA